jgi:hypothetical protein
LHSLFDGVGRVSRDQEAVAVLSLDDGTDPSTDALGPVEQINRFVAAALANFARVEERLLYILLASRHRRMLD